MYLRKVIRIRAEDSPNVRLALAQKAAGIEPTGEVLIPGLIDWPLYQTRRRVWDAKKQSIGLDAQFYKGKEVMLYPHEWMVLAWSRWESLTSRSVPRVAKAMGVDSAEGGDSSVWVVVDDLGVIEIVSLKTENTTAVPGRTIQLIHKYGLDPARVIFDRGGGGKQHADRLREQGYHVRTVGFGESPTDPDAHDRWAPKDPLNRSEIRYQYKNRRAEMYGLTRNSVNPDLGGEFAIPPDSAGEQYAELNRQLSLMPLLYDSEGRLYLPPKNKPRPNSQEKTLVEIIGRSPDEADGLVLARFGLEDPKRSELGAVSL